MRGRTGSPRVLRGGVRLGRTHRAGDINDLWTAGRRPPLAMSASSRYWPRWRSSRREWRSWRRGRARRRSRPGHEEQERRLLPPEAARHVVQLVPRHCQRCRQRLVGRDAAPRRHQVVEVPALSALVTEYRGHALECGACGKVTRWPVPAHASSAFATGRTRSPASRWASTGVQATGAGRALGHAGRGAVGGCVVSLEEKRSDTLARGGMSNAMRSGIQPEATAAPRTRRGERFLERARQEHPTGHETSFGQLRIPAWGGDGNPSPRW